jgi:hypothetical protein
MPLKIPKPGDKVLVVIPDGELPEAVAEVQAVNAEGVITARVLSDAKEPLVLRNAPHCPAESLKKKRRGNTWRWPD